jgi:hypothetical protein
MIHRTNRKCWKCGQNVRHAKIHTPYPKVGTRGQRRAWWFSRWFTAPTKHYVFKNGTFVECAGSGRSA